MEFGVIGLGNRGTVYSNCMRELGSKITYVVDPNPNRLQYARDVLGVPADHCFTDTDAFFALGKVADALFICTQDAQHYGHAMKALELKYPLLLEKPISNNVRECLEIRNAAEKAGVLVAVGHVLRYCPFFVKIKEILDSGKIGKIISIQHNENIGNYHIAHSYVRGNWRNEAESSPILLAKSSHDLDILIWLTGSMPESVASFGDLTYFRKENAPEGSTERCLDCPVHENCRFDVRKCYLPLAGQWPANVLTPDQSEEGLMEAFRTGPYGRCVFRCDNDVCDHQVTIIRFESGVTATFNLSGLTDRQCRTIKVMCEDGEIRGNMDLNEVEVRYFSPNAICERKIELYHPAEAVSGHGGGDMGLAKAFLSTMEGENPLTSEIHNSTASHVLAFAAEEARKTNMVVRLDDFEREIL